MTQFTNRQIAIFHATGQIILQEGWAGLTTKKIASQIGFTEGALYRHFKGKNEIISGLLIFIKQELDAVLSDVDPFLEPKEAFKTIFKVQFNFFTKSPYFLPILFSDTIAAGTRKLNIQFASLTSLSTEYLLPVIEQAQKKGQFTNQLTSENLLDIALGTFRLEILKWSKNQNKSNSIEKQMLLINQLLLLFKKSSNEN
ncbi:MAG: TetR/AcrR family transcriptional regulator [Crocinitomicaceae bacterium]